MINVLLSSGWLREVGVALETVVFTTARKTSDKYD